MMNKRMFLIIVILSLFAIVFVNHNDFLYAKPIMKISKMENEETEVYTNMLGFEEKHFIKKISGVITNGDDYGKSVTFEYEETYSSIVTDKYRVGDKVFINSYEIEGLKRDRYLVILVCLFVLAMFLVGQFRGLLAIISVIFNSFVFYLGLIWYFNKGDLLLLCIGESVIFTCFSLFIASGINKKTMSAILSVLVSLCFLLVMLFVVVNLTDYSGINFNEISFITVPYTDIILPELFIGSLGAIMDVAITMSSSISELIDKDAKITKKALKRSGNQVGRDIMSTMINVLFFTYLCSGLPIFVLAVRNGFTVYNYVTTSFSLELARFLVGAIGIVMTIPISIFISIKVFKKGDSYE